MPDTFYTFYDGLEGGNYDRVSLPTLKKIARALGAAIEIKLSA